MVGKGGRDKQKSIPRQHGGPAKPPREMLRYLEQLHYPSRKQDLVYQARDWRLPTDVIHVLQRLPDKPYNTPREVEQAARQG